MRWCQVLALFFGGTGAIWALSLYIFTTSELSLPQQFAQSALVGVAAVSVGVSAGAWFGHRWALVALRIVAWASLACVVALAVADTLTYSESGEALGELAIENAAIAAMLVPFPILLLIVLYRGEVVRDFGGNAHVP
jgi:hypothetical protein